MTSLARLSEFKLFCRELILDETRLFKFFVGISIAAHLMIALVSLTNLFSWSVNLPMPNEWGIEAELAMDMTSESSKDTLSNAKEAEEILVPKQILPQLPKTVEVEENDDLGVVKETVPDELSKVKPPPALDPGKDQELEEKKRDAAVKLKKQEAIDRLLKEKARENQKFADVTSSPLSDSLQRRKAQLAVGGGGSEGSNYQSQIYRSIRKFYSIPETYRIKGDSLTAQIKISISPSGAILVMEVENSSGETGFDQLVMDIIRKAEPLPAPPTELIGKQLLLSFNP
jgi:protein TonB